jgi:hypothetical protein
VAWLASPAGGYVTGQLIVVDGGNSIAEERALARPREVDALKPAQSVVEVSAGFIQMVAAKGRGHLGAFKP